MNGTKAVRKYEQAHPSVGFPFCAEDRCIDEEMG